MVITGVHGQLMKHVNFKNMQKKIIIIVSLFVLVLISVFLVILTSQKNSIIQPDNEKNYFISKDSLPNKIDLNTTVGKISIQNPEKIAEETLGQKDFILRETQNYSILYSNYTEGPSFMISILGDNPENTKKIAESDFLKILEITQEQACSLNVVVNYPFSEDERLQNTFPLSFCSE